MGAATFQRADSSDPLYVLNGAIQTTLPGYTAAFALAPGQPSAPLSVSLEASWSTLEGVYLFLGEPPADHAAFAAELAILLQYPSRAGALFVWIANPNDPGPAWQMNWIAAAGKAATKISQVSVRNIELLLGSGCAIALNAGQDGFTFTLPAAGFAALAALHGGGRLDVDSPVTLSFDGGQTGCLRFGLTLDNSGSTHPPDIDRLDAGMRFFANDLGWQAFSRLRSLRYPLFDPSSAPSLPLDVSLDLLDPLDGNRSWFGLLPGGGGNGPTLTSCYITNMGRRLGLTPIPPPAETGSAGSPRFVLAVRALGNPVRDIDPFYLTPAGTFAVSFIGDSARAPVDGIVERVVCGVAGTEYIGLPAASGNVMSFFADQPAYAPGFGNPGGGTAGAPGLIPVATTSWAYLTPPADGAALQYFAQPLESSFFNAGSANAAKLDFYEISVGTLPPTVAPPAAMFPMAPMAGVDRLAPDDPGLAPFAAFESQILSPSRRAVISANAVGSPRTAATVSVGTPAGVLGTVNLGAQTTIDLTFAQSNGLTLGFTGVQGTLLDAFQSGQQFLVLSSETLLTNPLYLSALLGSKLTIESQQSDVWTFDVYGGWTLRNSILIFKFGAKPLIDLVNDTSSWADGAAFNQSVAATQADLRAIIADALTRAETEPDFDYFANTVVTDPNWNGLLVLRCEVPLDGLPEQIAGLAAGIDPKKFYAHHFGITMTPLTVTGLNVGFKADSSLFGLIYYNDPADLVSNGSPYQFKVLNLKVLFANSAIASFSSQIEMNIGQLFGEPVVFSTPKDANANPPTTYGPNNLVLNGTYQKLNGKGTYLFLNNDDTQIAVTSKVLDTVEVLKAQYVTVVAPDQVPLPPPDANAESRLLLSGNLDFLALHGFDLFSFGTDQGGLRFSGLAIDVFYQAHPPEDAVPQKSFQFDASKIAFDLSATYARKQSLYAGFPLLLTGFRQVDANLNPDDASTTPSSLGYLDIDAPLAQSGLTAPWFGLVFTLQLGSAGALAAKGGFSSSVLAAWSPSADSPSVSMGLTLPGSGGPQKLLSLESVLKLKIKHITFKYTDDGDYILNLNNITLSLLSLSFPSSGQTNAFLFGDTRGGDSSTLGWYAAYAKNAPASGAKTPARLAKQRVLGTDR